MRRRRRIVLRLGIGEDKGSKLGKEEDGVRGKGWKEEDNDREGKKKVVKE